MKSATADRTIATATKMKQKKTVRSKIGNVLPPTTERTVKLLNYTASLTMKKNTWKSKLAKKKTQAIPNYRKLSAKSRVTVLGQQRNWNESLQNFASEINVIDNIVTNLKNQTLISMECNKSINETTRENVQFGAGEATCKPYYEVFDVCRTSERYYPADSTCMGLCRETNKERICKKLSVSQIAGEQVIRINCTMKVCKGRPVSVAVVDHDYGIARKHKYYYDIESLQRGVQKAVSKSIRHGINFVFLSCTKTTNKTDRMKVEQILPIPLIFENIERKRQNNRKGNNAPGILPPNINVMVLDSISRAHFQRALPHTAKVLKAINRSSRSGATVLDFKLFQSLAPFTFVNIKSFMSGKQGYTSLKDRDIGFKVLFERLKQAEYQTTAQEDTCWYDKWGSILTGNRKRDTAIRNLHEKKAEWRKFNQITHEYKPNSLGLSHSSCYILKKYGRTNMFNEGTSFCYDGKPLSSHLLEYATSLHTSQESSVDAKPQFTYTHINIGHETTGKRACVVDKELSGMVTRLAKLNNTVTILWSDHGAKTTQYSIETMPGKFETYDAFLFLLFPNAVLKVIGEKRMTAILKNQKAIVSSVDLHATILALSGLSNHARDMGLFSDKTWRRGCENLPVRGYSLCKCVNNYRFLNLKNRTDFFDVLWMAEFAIGTLNDRLNKQLLTNKKGNILTRNCHWLQGLRFRDALLDKKSLRYIFDVIIHGKKLQVFNIQIKQYQNDLSLFHWQRTSVYQDFDICKDKGVSLELCICDRKNKHGISFDLQDIMYSRMFGVENTVHIVSSDDDGCLALIERNHENEVISFSIANSCEIKYLINIAKTRSYDAWRTSGILPMNLTAIENSITFITSARKMKNNARKLNLIITKMR